MKLYNDHPWRTRPKPQASSLTSTVPDAQTKPANTTPLDPENTSQTDTHRYRTEIRARTPLPHGSSMSRPPVTASHLRACRIAPDPRASRQEEGTPHRYSKASRHTNLHPGDITHKDLPALQKSQKKRATRSPSPPPRSRGRPPQAATTHLTQRCRTSRLRLLLPHTRNQWYRTFPFPPDLD